MRKTTFFIILFLVFSGICFAQQNPIYSQYILNEFIINPAVAGIDGMTTINLSGRKQWAGVQYSPETYSASISARILKSPFSVKGKRYRKGSQGRVGLGSAFIADKNGAINRTTIQFSYAYHLFIQNYQLSFGLKLFGTELKIDDELITFRDDTDPITSMVGKSAFLPDAGAGINFSAPNAQVGLSASHLLESILQFGDIQIDSQALEHVRNYNLYGHYRRVLANRDWTFEHSAMVRSDEKLNLSAETSVRFIYNREYWAGLSVRTSGEFILLAGIKLNRAYIGYSFDYGLNELSYRSYGSHEIVLALKLGDSVRRYRWLERY